jgi:hypothetical protein
MRQGRFEPGEWDEAGSERTKEVKVILIQAVLEVTRNTARESRFSGDGQKKLHHSTQGHADAQDRVVKEKPGQS